MTLSLAVVLAACVQAPPKPGMEEPLVSRPAVVAAAGPLAYLALALEAGPKERELLWAGLEPGPAVDEPQQRLRRAVLESVPGHTGHNPAAAKQHLELLSHNQNVDISLVARVRLAELRVADDCHNEVVVLRKRLSSVVDIERDLKNNGQKP